MPAGSQTRRYTSLFQAIHGSAPDIAGKGTANPIASIWSGQLLLDHLGEQEAADTLMRAIEEALEAGEVRTPDLGGTATTRQLGEAIRTHLQKANEDEGSIRSPYDPEARTGQKRGVIWLGDIRASDRNVCSGEI